MQVFVVLVVAASARLLRLGLNASTTPSCTGEVECGQVCGKYKMSYCPVTAECVEMGDCSTCMGRFMHNEGANVCEANPFGLVKGFCGDKPGRTCYKIVNDLTNCLNMCAVATMPNGVPKIDVFGSCLMGMQGGCPVSQLNMCSDVCGDSEGESKAKCLHSCGMFNNLKDKEMQYCDSPCNFACWITRNVFEKKFPTSGKPCTEQGCFVNPCKQGMDR
mmetsp:Transcript_5631/g.13386  ORF Transcript_5631/g.13386 Transcript_5631/m.13386 type:complete len:218 (+) Transcript_5631:159-812(+)